MNFAIKLCLSFLIGVGYGMSCVQLKVKPLVGYGIFFILSGGFVGFNNNYFVEYHGLVPGSEIYKVDYNIINGFVGAVKGMFDVMLFPINIIINLPHV